METLHPETVHADLRDFGLKISALRWDISTSKP